MTRYAVAVVALTTAWVAFWRDLSVANVASGVVASVVVLALFPYGPRREGLELRLLPLVKFAAVFTWSVVKANAVVAWEVVTPRNRINEGIVAVPLNSTNPLVITVVSHAIILAPGTMVVDVDLKPETVLFVHALHLRSVEAVHREVLQLERLVLEAFGGLEQAPTREPVP